MYNLTHIELSDLYDLLAQHTNRYMKMLSEGATREEFDQCREIMIAIQIEIRVRRRATVTPAFVPPGTRFA